MSCEEQDVPAFLFFAFNLPFYFFTVLPLRIFRLQNPENLNNVLVNNIINN